MRLKDIKKVGVYLGRIVKDPFSKQSRAAMKRYFAEIFTLLYEKIRGLDFTMIYQCDSGEHNNNYSKSPKKVLRRVFDDIDFSEPHGFCDMGCGKGYVMICASEYPFKNIGGVEYTPELCTICSNNLRKLKLDEVKVFNCDAKVFDKYEDYDVFYFGNPFDETIISVVASRILDAHKDNKCWIYYLNPYIEERQKAIRDAGFKLVKVIEDDNEKYLNINVYEN
ncbi:MAG: class I SAM-dependent methyltransferase [Lachnospiraceae bacterium]|nr:class I SAM-dependent methyltransferase [Lachnospiraceae bacterium]